MRALAQGWMFALIVAAVGCGGVSPVAEPASTSLELQSAAAADADRAGPVGGETDARKKVCRQLCRVGEQCVNGHCIPVDPVCPPCDEYQECVNGVCVTVDPLCGPCGPYQECVNGQCVTVDPVCPVCLEDMRCVRGRCVRLPAGQQKLGPGIN